MRYLRTVFSVDIEQIAETRSGLCCFGQVATNVNFAEYVEEDRVQLSGPSVLRHFGPPGRDTRVPPARVVRCRVPSVVPHSLDSILRQNMTSGQKITLEHWGVLGRGDGEVLEQG